MPFHQELNQSGDVSGCKYDIAPDLGLRSKSIIKGENQLLELKDLFDETSVDKDEYFFQRQEILQSKSSACDNLLQLKRNPNEIFNESSVVGNLFEQTFKSIYENSNKHLNLSKITEKDKFSEKESEQFVGYISESISKLCDAYKQLNISQQRTKAVAYR